MKHFLSQLIPQIIKNYGYHLPLAIFASIYFGFPARYLNIIGVTGTNGKTTTTKLIARILEQAGNKVAMASTIEYQIREKHWANASKFTTPSAWEIQKFLRHAVDAQCEWAVLETSSHALDQHRVWGIVYQIAVITNVTREHLDYHLTMERYRRAKERLFAQAKRAAINLDMENPGEYLAGNYEETLTYSTKNPEANIFAKDINLDFKGATFIAAGQAFVTKLPGLFNIENVLAAIAVGTMVGVEKKIIAEALATVAGISGRMELVENTLGLDIIIDYAVTPDAFEKLYQTVMPLKIPGTKIVHVFGACGERDRGKRPDMGRLASEKSDVIILTNEDPYHEDPERILDEIESGIERKKPGENFYRIFDRREAIRKALEISEQGDIVLITGKGAEETMAFGDERVPWKERDVIKEELMRLMSFKENGER